MEEPYHDNGWPIVVTTSANEAINRYLDGRKQESYATDDPGYPDGRYTWDENRSLYVVEDGEITRACGPWRDAEHGTIEDWMASIRKDGP